jgi:FkbM family methyltransferase
LEVNNAYVYKNCALVHEIDDYLMKYNFKRIETKWTNENWGDALYINIKLIPNLNHNYKILNNIRYSQELWNINATFEEALERANSDPRVKVLHWNNTRYGDSRITNIKGWYQGACGNIETTPNTSWDTVLLKEQENMCFDIGANIGKWTNANLGYYNKIISVEASPYIFDKLKQNCKNDKIILLNYAICDNNNKEIKFYQAENHTLSTINKDWLIDSKSRFFNEKYKEIICKTNTIDNLILQYGKPNLIKIDVEGGEFECIKSLTQKVDFLCFEWACETNNITLKCLDYLFTLGFTKFYIQNSDDYTFIPEKTKYDDLSLIKSKLDNMIPKKDWGMIWCI